MGNQQIRYVLTEEIEASLKKIDEVERQLLENAATVRSALAEFRTELQELRRSIDESEFRRSCRHKLAKNILN